MFAKTKFISLIKIIILICIFLKTAFKSNGCVVIQNGYNKEMSYVVADGNYCTVMHYLNSDLF